MVRGWGLALSDHSKTMWLVLARGVLGRFAWRTMLVSSQESRSRVMTRQCYEDGSQVEGNWCP